MRSNTALNQKCGKCFGSEIIDCAEAPNTTHVRKLKPITAIKIRTRTKIMVAIF